MKRSILPNVVRSIWLFCISIKVGLSIAQKQMCQINGHGLLRRSHKVIYVVDVNRISYNGPAIWGGCVTRRWHRAGSRYFSREVVTSLTLTDRRERHGVQGGYGAFFAIRVQSFVAFTSFAVQSCHWISQLSRCS